MIRILSLDDEPELLKLYGLIFEHKGYDHIGSANSYEAWVLLHADHFDLWTEDLARPEVDGWQFLQALQDEASPWRVPLIILSARALDVEQLTARQLSGFDDYLSLPVGPEELLNSVQRVCAKYDLQLRVLPPARDHSPFRGFSAAEEVLSAWAAAEPEQRYLALVKLRWNEKLHPSAAKFLPLLAEAFQDSDPDIRLSAAKTAGALADSTIVQPLLSLLDDANRDVATTALRALGQLNDPAGRAAILPLLHQSDWRLRCLAALALQSDKDESVEAALLPLLNDGVKLVQLAATLALKEHSQDDVVEALSASLSSSDRWLRDATVVTLGSTHNPLAVDKLAPLLKDTDSHIVWRVINAMQELGAAALPPLRELAAQDMAVDEHDWSVAKAAAHAVHTIEKNLRKS